SVVTANGPGAPGSGAAPARTAQETTMTASSSRMVFMAPSRSAGRRGCGPAGAELPPICEATASVLDGDQVLGHGLCELGPCQHEDQRVQVAIRTVVVAEELVLTDQQDLLLVADGKTAAAEERDLHSRVREGDALDPIFAPRCAGACRQRDSGPCHETGDPEPETLASHRALPHGQGRSSPPAAAGRSMRARGSVGVRIAVVIARTLRPRGSRS